jgi:hypothetical protein
MCPRMIYHVSIIGQTDISKMSLMLIGMVVMTNTPTTTEMIWETFFVVLSLLFTKDFLRAIIFIMCSTPSAHMGPNVITTVYTTFIRAAAFFSFVKNVTYVYGNVTSIDITQIIADATRIRLLLIHVRHFSG